MEIEERKFIDEATNLCESAGKRGVTILLVRRQDQNDGTDIVVTNASFAPMVAAMMGAHFDFGTHDIDEDE